MEKANEREKTLIFCGKPDCEKSIKAIEMYGNQVKIKGLSFVSITNKEFNEMKEDGFKQFIKKYLFTIDEINQYSANTNRILIATKLSLKDAKKLYKKNEKM